MPGKVRIKLLFKIPRPAVVIFTPFQRSLGAGMPVLAWEIPKDLGLESGGGVEFGEGSSARV